MLRKVAVPHAARALLAALAIALAASAAPARAEAESLSISPGSDPVAGLPNGVDYEYDTGMVTLSMAILARPSSGPQCQPTTVIDDANAGTTGGSTYLTPTPYALTGAGLGRVPYTFPAPGRYRICAWLYRSPDDVVAVTSTEVDVRAPATTITVTPEEVGASAGGADLSAHVVGTTEAPADMYVTVVAASTSCPPGYDEDTQPTTLDVTPPGTSTRVNGAFDLQFSTHDRLAFRRWRVCAFLQQGPLGATATAVGTSIVDFVLKPALLRKPRVLRKAGLLTCDGGRFRAMPAATYAFAWLRGETRIPGATGRTLRVGAKLRGKAVRCRVTARNRLGSTVATSRAVVAR